MAVRVSTELGGYLASRCEHDATKDAYSSPVPPPLCRMKPAPAPVHGEMRGSGRGGVSGGSCGNAHTVVKSTAGSACVGSTCMLLPGGRCGPAHTVVNSAACSACMGNA